MNLNENIAKRHHPKENMLITLGLNKNYIYIILFYFISNFIFPKHSQFFPSK
jgi:hypothetical protein